MKTYWQRPDQLRTLLSELVAWESKSLSQGEKDFPFKLEAKLRKMFFFVKHPELISLHQADHGRNFLTAIYKNPDAQKTVILMSHFDTVSTEEYGEFEPLAFYPEELTLLLKEHQQGFSDSVQHDLTSGEYLFGRGTADMKIGLAIHMQLLEKASIEKWPLNLLLVTVPDEEVGSAGMRAAVPVLEKLSKQHQLAYQLFLNSEPSFPEHAEDMNHYVYTGSVGKIMPSALFYGKESHAGEPLKGMTANFIASFLTQEMEWNDDFQEEAFGQKTPLPVNLQQRDLQQGYSTQTPFRAAALYNTLLLNRSPQEIMDLFHKTAQHAAERCNTAYQEICIREGIAPLFSVQVITYEELDSYARTKLGQETVDRLMGEISSASHLDEREKCIEVSSKLLTQCSELTPAIMLFFAPPYYPAINNSFHPSIEKSLAACQEIAGKHGIKLQRKHYFSGICDLSYTSYQGNKEELDVFVKNTPVWGSTYTIPFDEMAKFSAPVLNLGPYGRDVHQLTERVHCKSAFEHTTQMIEAVLRSFFHNKPQKKA